MPSHDQQRDDRYVQILLEPLRVCANYTPKIGQDESVTLDDFTKLYGADPLYHWIGFDSELMYAAHKAAGGMTSVYKQLGTGCERLFQAVMAEQTGLKGEDLRWGYDIQNQDGKSSHLELDGKIVTARLPDKTRQDAVEKWIEDAAKAVGINGAKKKKLQGAVFEVRQGYKSADAKRQNADIRSAIRAANEDYLFVVAIVSSQINQTVLRRYRNRQMLVMLGNLSGDWTTDTFAFSEKALGYSLKEFFERNSSTLRKEVEAILKQLLKPK